MITAIIVGLNTATVRNYPNGFLPRVGDQIDFGYTPYPFIKSVLLDPQPETFKGLISDDDYCNAASQNVKAIITIDGFVR